MPVGSFPDVGRLDQFAPSRVPDGWHIPRASRTTVALFATLHRAQGIRYTKTSTRRSCLRCLEARPQELVGSRIDGLGYLRPSVLPRLSLSSATSDRRD